MDSNCLPKNKDKGSVIGSAILWQVFNILDIKNSVMREALHDRGSRIHRNGWFFARYTYSRWKDTPWLSTYRQTGRTSLALWALWHLSIGAILCINFATGRDVRKQTLLPEPVVCFCTFCVFPRDTLQPQNDISKGSLDLHGQQFFNDTPSGVSNLQVAANNMQGNV